MPPPSAIRFFDLTKTYGKGKSRLIAVSHLQLEITPGQVYGFLGPNGAGKTTTIRMLMGLVRSSGGRVEVFGCDSRASGALRRVGALVEGPAFYGYLTARRNLEILARTADDFRPDRIRTLLEQVGLKDAADRRVGEYSLGMKQRLGLAAALLGDPDLVVLDEPTNGLDPSGIQEMRLFIRSLAADFGKTVFLSSHLLSEVEQICDRVAILQRGEVIREGPVADLLAEGKSRLRLQVSPLEKAEEVLSGRWRTMREEGSAENGFWLIVEAPAADGAEMVRLLVTAGVDVHQAVVLRQSLEEYFMLATREGGTHA
jgi:ABC-2 type transport system ATP-binding protein